MIRGRALARIPRTQATRDGIRVAPGEFRAVFDARAGKRGLLRYPVFANAEGAINLILRFQFYPNKVTL